MCCVFSVVFFFVGGGESIVEGDSESSFLVLVNCSLVMPVIYLLLCLYLTKWYVYPLVILPPFWELMDKSYATSL